GVPVFSPKGWEPSARGNAPGSRSHEIGSPKGCETAPRTAPAISQPFGLECSLGHRPRASPWAERSQPFGLKTMAVSDVRREEVQHQPDHEQEYGDPQAPAERLGEDLVPPVVPGRRVHQADHDQQDRQVPVDARGREQGGDHAGPPAAGETGAPASFSSFGYSRNSGPASAS